MRKTWVKILVPVLVLALVFTGVHIAVTGNNHPADTTFTFAVQDGKAVLTGSQDALSGAVMLPAEIEGYPVTGIGENAFQNCEDVTAFFLPDSVTSIGAYAFENCTALAQMILPEGLVSIGEGAFWKCASLRSVTLPVSVTEIGSCAFYKCDAMQSLIVPGSSTPVRGIFNVSLDIGQTIAVGNPARTVLDPIVTTVYCYNGSVAYKQTLTDEYSSYALLDNCTFTSYTVRYVDEAGEAVAVEKTVALQPVGIEVAVVAAAIDDDTLAYPEAPLQVGTLTEGDNIFTFVYPVQETTTESTTESTTEEPTTEEPTTEESTTEESTTEESTTEEPTTEEPTTEELTTEESTTEEPTTEEPSTEPPYVAPVLIAREGSGAVIDRERGYIYGVEPNMNIATLTEKYLDVIGNGHIEAQRDYWITTGVKVYLIDDRDGAILETLTVILFGDLDQDAMISTFDTATLKSLMNGEILPSEAPDIAFAADLDQDGILTQMDRAVIIGICNGSIHFDQSTRKS